MKGIPLKYVLEHKEAVPKYYYQLTCMSCTSMAESKDARQSRYDIRMGCCQSTSMPGNES